MKHFDSFNHYEALGTGRTTNFVYFLKRYLPTIKLKTVTLIIKVFYIVASLSNV